MAAREVAAGAPSNSATEGASVAFRTLLVVIVGLFLTHAWVVDDAYITFRTVDNFVNGLGLRWNPDERVQAYTHPLWLLLCSFCYALSGELFYTVIALSLASSLAALLLAAFALDRYVSPWAKVVLIGILLGSKAFLDFSSSGLENPLTHLILVGFFCLFAFSAEPWRSASTRRIALLFGIAALGFVNRQDTALFFFPACASVLLESLIARRVRAALAALAGLAPAFLWLGFSLFYYGSAVPNTAHAKLIGPHISLMEQFGVGVAYFLDSLYVDFATLPLCALSLGFALRWRSRPSALIAIGMLLYLAYVLFAGAVGTHMSGRFFSGAVLVAALLIATLGRTWAVWMPALCLSLLVFVASPRSPLRVGTSTYATEITARKTHYVIDTREHVLAEGAALLDDRHDAKLPEHAAYHAGQAFRSSKKRVHVAGPGRGFERMVGYSGFAVGPRKHIVDTLGLTDPLLARLPIAKTSAWRPGHFLRAMPPGYRASIEQKKNLIEDPDLRAYYQVILDVTRGTLWSASRLGQIWRLNTGQYDHLLRAYASRSQLRR